MTPVQIIARALARNAGFDPDAPSGMQRRVGGDNGRRPTWEQYAPAADAIWAELQRAGYAKV
jgi:hypothetical protein